jgi:hypothetical protein
MNVSKGDAVTYVALVTAAVLQAAEPWRKEAAVPPDLHPILSSPVWAYIPLALLFIVGVIWLFRQIKPNRTPPQSSATEAGKEAVVDRRKVASDLYLKEAHVYAGADGNPEMPPRVRVCFGRSGKAAEVCIDFSYFVGAIGFAGWSKRRRLLLAEIKSFRRDEDLHFQLMSRDTITESSIGWRWGDARMRYPNKAEGILRQDSHYRCRVAFIFADGAEEYIYFLVETAVSTEPFPAVIEARAFDFISEWERE